MPVVIIQLLEGRTQEQKDQIAKAVTDAIATIGKTKPENTHVIFNDTKGSDWFVAGKAH